MNIFELFSLSIKTQALNFRNIRLIALPSYEMVFFSSVVSSTLMCYQNVTTLVIPPIQEIKYLADRGIFHNDLMFGHRLNESK
jgi:hypothetical protein